jgi:hypothetical protein
VLYLGVGLVLARLKETLELPASRFAQIGGRIEKVDLTLIRWSFSVQHLSLFDFFTGRSTC